MKKRIVTALLIGIALLSGCAEKTKEETKPAAKVQEEKERTVSKEMVEVPFSLEQDGVYADVATLSVPSDYILHAYDYLDDTGMFAFKGARRTKMDEWLSEDYEELEISPFLYSFSLYDQEGIEQATNAYQDFMVYPEGEEETYEINYHTSETHEDPKEVKQGQGEVNGIPYEYEYIVMGEEERIIGEYGYTCIYHLKDNIKLCHTTGLAQDDGFDPEVKAKEIGQAITIK